MFDDFKNAVLNSYAEQKANHKLSDNLINPTRVKLKNECLNILKKRYDKKDDEIIKAFFDPYNEFSSHEQSIDKFDLDGFQALITFFKRDINIRLERNIKFLAWLIDFEPRPYDKEYDYSILPKSDPEPKQSKLDEKTTPPQPDLPKPIKETTGSGFDQPKPVEKNVAPKKKWKNVGIAALFLVLIGFSTLYISSQAKIEETPKNDIPIKVTNTPLPIKIISTSAKKSSATKKSQVDKKQCMYWANDHYEAIECDKTIEGVELFQLDNQILNQLKRITRPDTLTKKNLGKTWYVKVNMDSVEFYTDSGSYPLNIKKRLMPLSSYILKKYPKGFNIYKK